MGIEKHLINLPENFEESTWNEKLNYLYQQQFQSWQMVNTYYKRLNSIQIRNIQFDNFNINIQHNPTRVRSTCADTKKESIEKRPCFLCANNLPAEQLGFIIREKYLMLINPFPIFERHLTISDVSHSPQQIENRIIDMLTITRELKDFTIFYNGPKCGASAPDHFHFQAVQKGAMPIDNDIQRIEQNTLFKNEDIHVFELKNYMRKAIVFESEYMEPIDYFFAETKEKLPTDSEWKEPMMNLLANYQDEKYRLIMFPRKAQRSSHFFEKEEDKIMVSPASVEMSGLFITPVEKDFHLLSNEIIKEIYSEVSLNDFNYHSETGI